MTELRNGRKEVTVYQETARHIIISQYGLTLNLRKKTLKYSSNLLIVEDGTHRRIINGKLMANYRAAGLFT